jgi:hypothetical protein
MTSVSESQGSANLFLSGCDKILTLPKLGKRYKVAKQFATIRNFAK